MEQVIGVRFKPAGKIYYFDSNNLDIHLDDGVIVETSRGKEYGYAVLFPKNPKIEGDDPLKPIIRKATMKDMAQLEQNKEREKSAFGICLKKIEKYKIPMKLLRVEYTFDRNKIVFFFTSEGRVDFRELVKDLASVFHTRIELRQVGVRDEAKQVSGIGSCGRPLCCATFLGEFAPVSIKMAKNQGLSLNPSKISGVCGRLMCCLRYENDQYEGDTKKKRCCMDRKKGPLFRVGMKVVTEEGSGQVIYVNSQKHTVKVQLEGQKTKIFPWDEVEKEENG
ncbi:stage 0 sporulation family protein [uncultured Dialister sp.]|uniref:PSP1 domain-containing protein n=1 Tax=uncultured Dialister sp. TaxID=278064 RepID=UPI0027DE803C|nr:stage 0 sporulation family protein [uncultured Dialister sp.]